MCGRWALGLAKQDLEQETGYSFPPDSYYRQSYNVKPTQNQPLIHDGKFEIMKWGFSLGKTFVINCRSDTLLVKPTFTPIKHQRCVIPVQGYYEWNEKTGQPYFIHSEDKLMYFACIWRNESGIKHFVTITTEASPNIMPVHHRMPVILKKEEIGKWNNPQTTIQEIVGMMRPTHDLVYHTVSSKVNSIKNDGPELIKHVKIQTMTDFFPRKSKESHSDSPKKRPNVESDSPQKRVKVEPENPTQSPIQTLPRQSPTQTPSRQSHSKDTGLKKVKTEPSPKKTRPITDFFSKKVQAK
ncbi:hypothetical protein EDD86DRAFT_204881 [Gorgonomyces haynaldii]|nr:hypothetical protein EDD86DRAFT_204881 [Gorgonomyces haynaldii]